MPRVFPPSPGTLEPKLYLSQTLALQNRALQLDREKLRMEKNKLEILYSETHAGDQFSRCCWKNRHSRYLYIIYTKSVCDSARLSEQRASRPVLAARKTSTSAVGALWALWRQRCAGLGSESDRTRRSAGRLAGRKSP